ncbi:hypothetical protein KUTeg_022527 [Tegillarca granosa]|uniref:Short-chain collagen C4-like n=1 Tax=Tegillarca granosa TaxID=220873 RepID=A0ABQ9E6H9_TEGGR|nr:hypothetical protein KUTeg_022527 [Tegillarca granosa]
MELYTYDGVEPDVHLVTLNLCTQNDKLQLLKGYAAGALYTENAGTDTQCLPKNPNWRIFHDVGNEAARIYGAEYRTGYSIGEALHKTFTLYEVPCAVCQTKDRCYSRWHLEYRGYLMTQNYQHGASNYACVDARPEITGSKANLEGRLFYPVESVCGSLPCPPYVNHRELTCAVCTF